MPFLRRPAGSWPERLTALQLNPLNRAVYWAVERECGFLDCIFPPNIATMEVDGSFLVNSLIRS